MRRGIREMLEDQPDIEVVGEGQDGEEAIALAQEKNPDVILMDVEMPELDGVEATRRILEDNPGIKVLVLTIHDEEEYLGALLHAGASGYVLKSTGCDDLAEAARLVGHGDIDSYASGRGGNPHCQADAGTAVDGPGLEQR